MAENDVREPGADKAQKPSIIQTIGAAIAGMIAVKIATYLMTTMWRLVTREDPPQVDERAPAVKKAMWLGMVGAASGAARQTARDLIKPPTEGPA